jgi:4-hydroxymandelate oxidase
MRDPIINLHDYRRLALERLDPRIADYLEGGALDETAVAANEEAWRRIRLVPRVLRDVSVIDTATTLLGRHASMPIGIAPTARHSFYDPDGEVATARAAATAGVPFVASTMSSFSLEDTALAGGTQWFQLYTQADRKFTESLVRRAAASGYRALVVTVDVPASARRERDLRLGEDAPDVPIPNLEGVILGLAGAAAAPTLTWDDIAWLRGLSEMSLVLKGIPSPEDARLAVEHGAAAVWVSNHGGRQLDRAVAPIDVLPSIVAAVGDRAEVYVDGGVRRGLDAAIAVALGARAVFVGRPILWALAVAGEEGVAHALTILRDELINSMAQLGAPTLDALVPSMIRSGH